MIMMKHKPKTFGEAIKDDRFTFLMIAVAAILLVQIIINLK